MLDPFYVIVDSAAWIARLLPCGVRLVQLRIKDQPDANVRAEIKEAKALCERHGAQLVVNDYWQQAIDTGCTFIHLGQGDLNTADLTAIRRAGVRFGISTHDEAELFCALETEPDYIALGPIFPTILKAMAFAPRGNLLAIASADDSTRVLESWKLMWMNQVFSSGFFLREVVS